MDAELSLRPIEARDAGAIQRLAGDAEVARTCRLPHPLPPGEGERFASRAAADWSGGSRFVFMVMLGEEPCGITMLEPSSGKAYLSYWIGLPYWSRGIATFAAAETVRFAFEALQLAEIRAIVLKDNGRSQQVLRNNGFVPVAHAADEREPLGAFGHSSTVVYQRLRADKPREGIAMSLQELLDGYAKLYDMAPLELDANDMCRLRFRDAIDVDIEASKRPNHVHVYCVVGRIPPTALGSFYRGLLEANLFGRDTGAASLGCDPETDEVILWRLLDIEGLAPERFDLALQDFVQSAAQLTERLKSQAPPDPPDDDRSMFMRTLQMRV